MKIYNRLEGNFNLTSKKALFLNMRLYYDAIKEDVFNTVPLTFHIKGSASDPEYKVFDKYFNELKNSGNKKEKNIWIVKPGENSNRGVGIFVSKS